LGGGIYVGGRAYDSRRHRYYYTAPGENHTKRIFEFDVKNREYTNRTWVFDDLIQSMQYDYKRDQLIGLQSGKVVGLHLASGKLIQLAQHEAGIANLYDSVFDEETDMFVFGTTKLSQYNRVVMNVATKKFKVIPHFTSCKHTYLIPKIRN
jgi:hypothetical protein